jgi:hypothetical protein
MSRVAPVMYLASGEARTAMACAFLDEQIRGGFPYSVRAGIDERVFSLNAIVHSVLASWIVERLGCNDTLDGNCSFSL